MVVFRLCVKAELENVEEIIPEEHMRFCLDVRARTRSRRRERAPPTPRAESRAVAAAIQASAIDTGEIRGRYGGIY
jgi:hypothetical protein